MYKPVAFPATPDLRVLKQEQETSKNQKQENIDIEEDNDEGSSNNDDLTGGLMRPVIELVKGFIPRLVKKPTISRSN